MTQQTNYLYCLTFPNGKKYIGKSVRPYQRLREHCNPKSRIILVNRAVQKYGAPLLQVLCAGDEPYIAELEIAAIAAFRTREPDYGYNVSLGGELSPMLVPEIAAKISALMKGRKKPPEHSVRMSALHKGKVISQGHRDAITRALTGKTMPPEAIAKSAAARKGVPQPKNRKPKSAEMRAKIKAYRTGKRWSEESKAKMRAAKLGKKQSPETVAKRVAAVTGQKRSPETRQKMSISSRAQWARRREANGLLKGDGGNDDSERRGIAGRG